MVAQTYAMIFSGIQRSQEYEQILKQLANFDLSGLAEFHSNIASLKALSTWWCAEIIEQSRQCLGGHGFSAYSYLRKQTEI